jgi:hypothetical protein
MFGQSNLAAAAARVRALHNQAARALAAIKNIEFDRILGGNLIKPF